MEGAWATFKNALKNWHFRSKPSGCLTHPGELYPVIWILEAFDRGWFDANQPERRFDLGERVFQVQCL
jgi:hypothetical protein